MPINEDGVLAIRPMNALMGRLLGAMRDQFGSDVDVTENSTIRKLMEAAVALPLVDVDNDLFDIYNQMFFETATGGNLDKLLEPFGFQRLPSQRSSGTINLTLENAEPAGAWLSPGDVTFIDTNGRKYDLISSIAFNGTTSVEGTILCQELGTVGNIPGNSITKVAVNNPASPTFNATVASFTNDLAIVGGKDAESDFLFRQRVRNLLASRETASVAGITTALLSTSGVTGATVTENSDLVGGQENKLYENTTGGTASTTVLDSTGDKIAQKITVAKRRWVQHFSAKLNADTDLVATVKLEGDATGSPDGTALLSYSGFDFDATNSTGGQWSDGVFLDPGDYWLVFEWESGSGTFDGDTGGTADQVKGDTGGGWALDTTVENLYASLIGGLPPKSFRAYVSGGLDDDVGQKIFETKAAGIYSDGSTASTVTDLSGNSHTLYFERPTLVPLVLDITVTKTAAFNGNEDSIRDVVIEYIGGTDSNSVTQIGLAVEEKAVRNEIISRILDDDNIAGLEDVITLRLGDRATYPTPASLTSGQESNLIPTIGQEYTIDDPANDIRVTINEA